MARDMMAPGEFIEVFIDTPLSVAEEWDVKGLYAKARSGKLRNLTGIDSPYEVPIKSDLHMDTTTMLVEEPSEEIVSKILGLES